MAENNPLKDSAPGAKLDNNKPSSKPLTDAINTRRKNDSEIKGHTQTDIERLQRIREIEQALARTTVDQLRNDAKVARTQAEILKAEKAISNTTVDQLRESEQKARSQLTEAEAKSYMADGGFFNRKWLLEDAEKQIVEAQRTGEPLYVLFLDLDNFKSYNSYYFYEGGNKVIELMHTLPSREEEVIARYAGDEFAQIIDKDIELENLHPLTMRYRASLEKNSRALIKDLPVDGNRDKELWPDDKKPENVTMSLGIAVWEGETAAELIEKASIAAKYSKDHGKDHTTFVKKNPNGDTQAPLIFQKVDETFARAA